MAIKMATEGIYHFTAEPWHFVDVVAVFFSLLKVVATVRCPPSNRSLSCR